MAVDIPEFLGEPKDKTYAQHTYNQLLRYCKSNPKWCKDYPARKDKKTLIDFVENRDPLSNWRRVKYLEKRDTTHWGSIDKGDIKVWKHDPTGVIMHLQKDDHLYKPIDYYKGRLRDKNASKECTVSVEGVGPYGSSENRAERHKDALETVWKDIKGFMTVSNDVTDISNIDFGYRCKVKGLDARKYPKLWGRYTS